MEERGDCLTCMKPVAPDGACLKCAECTNHYHTGKCSGITTKALKTMTSESISRWRCGTCKLHAERQSVSPEELGSVSGEGSQEGSLEKLVQQNDAINRKLTALLIRINAIEKSLETQTGKGDELMSKIENQGRTIEGIEESMNNQSARHQELMTRLESQDKTIKGLEQKVNQLEEKITQRDEEIWALRKAVDNAEQYSRRQNIEIHGVTQQPNESLLEVINDIATKLGVPQLATTDVEAAHRLRAKEGRPAPILVRFTERRTRDVWAKKRVSLRSENIYINENLTRAIKNLLWTTKACSREKNYKYTWVKNGKIFVRQNEGAAAIQIESERDFAKIR
ncbi:uncharacterized protein LOC120841521 [Ixodes scapularis]|uniref:uncharacterized protein LOC120841521 n=1 Tax=Ixodes scapularis TaxID=6945 RepID=UPI001A9DD7C4|nr:uncharacterized protein LOC120841521 [Ixodes scapularis]